MASRQRRKSSSSNSKGGSSLFGVLIGLIIGLAAAAVVAYLVTQAPMPFADKASREPAQTLLPDVREAPDPNLGLYGTDGAAGAQADGPTATPPTPLPPSETHTSQTNQPPQAQGGGDDIGALLATLGTGEQAAPKAAETSKPASPPKPAQPPAASAPQKPAAPAQAPGAYYLQAGAFRSETDAQSIRARIIMMGLPVQVQTAQVNGAQLHRVRVGPFQGIDEMNRSRVKLGEAKIESSVVRP